jgi:hypothetical protein
MDDERFDELPYRGEPLPLDDDSAAGEWAQAFRMLRNAGVAPPWIEADKEVRDLLARREALLERVARAPRGSRAGPSPAARQRARDELEALVAAINRAVARLNAEAPTSRQHRRLLDLATELAALDDLLA